MKALARSSFVTLALVAATALGARAQTVGGSVVDELGGTPVSGAVVALFDPAGARVRTTLSRSDGSFVLQDVPAGTYRLKADMIGRRSVESEPFEVSAEPLTLRTLRLPVDPIRLDGLDVTAAGRCAVGRDVARETHLVWQEVQKALQAESITREEARYRFYVTEYHRELDVRTRIPVRQSTEQKVWLARSPFSSLPPEEIERGGFVKGEGEETLIYGPDTDVLLSLGFQSTHCFSLERDRERPGQIGLRFEPVRGRNLPDIEGVLWVDERSAELRTLEFRYRNMPRRLVSGEYSGYAAFQRLGDGSWIIQNWWLRSPVLEERAEVTRIEAVPPGLERR